jgi:hypothetical protein
MVLVVTISTGNDRQETVRRHLDRGLTCERTKVFRFTGTEPADSPAAGRCIRQDASNCTDDQRESQNQRGGETNQSVAFAFGSSFLGSLSSGGVIWGTHHVLTQVHQDADASTGAPSSISRGICQPKSVIGRISSQQMRRLLSHLLR